MKAVFQKENQKLTVSVSGKLDSNTSHTLETELKEHFDGVNELIFDFTELNYISSAGIRVLLASYKRLSGNLKVLHANELICKIFEVTGLSSFFCVE